MTALLASLSLPVVAIMISADRAALTYLLPTIVAVSVAIVAATSRGRKPLELVTLGLAWATILAGLTLLVFHVALQRPLIRIEVFAAP